MNIERLAEAMGQTFRMMRVGEEGKEAVEAREVLYAAWEPIAEIIDVSIPQLWEDLTEITLAVANGQDFDASQLLAKIGAEDCSTCGQWFIDETWQSPVICLDCRGKMGLG